MSPPNYLYSGLLLASGMVCLLVALFAWQLRKSAAGSVPLVVFMLALAWWDIAYAVFWIDFPAPTPYFWLDITYLGAVIVPTALLVFAIQLTGLERWLKKPILAALMVEPILVTFALWTDNWHGLFFGGQRLVNAGMILTGGIIFWANVIYSYLFVFVTLLLFLGAYRNAVGLYRKQFGTILFGIAITWANSIIFVTGFNPLPGADNTPFSFTLTGIVFAFALFRYRLLDVVPIARSMLVDSLPDGVMVLDSANRIVDLNPVAARLLPDAKIGQSVTELQHQLPEALQKYRELSNIRDEVELDNPRRYLDVKISDVQDARQRILGRLVVWRDITELKTLQMELQDFAMHDTLTRAYNRRHFEQLAKSEWAHGIRSGDSMAFVLADIDHFKNINDSYGHQAGDSVLIGFARLCNQTKRPHDIFARWGGEEFIFLLPQTNGDAALHFAERLRKQVDENGLQIGDATFQITCSFGVSAIVPGQDSLDALFKQADAALYQAKDGGRNRAVLYHP